MKPALPGALWVGGLCHSHVPTFILQPSHRVARDGLERRPEEGESVVNPSYRTSPCFLHHTAKGNFLVSPNKPAVCYYSFLYPSGSRSCGPWASSIGLTWSC